MKSFDAVLMSTRSRFLLLLVALCSIVLCSDSNSHADRGIPNCRGGDFYFDTSREKVWPGAEWLRVIGYIGGKFFSYAPHHEHMKEDFISFPIDLAKLLFNDSRDPDLFNEALVFDDELDFARLVHLNQDQDGKLYVFEYGQREIDTTADLIRIGKPKSAELFYTVINRTNPDTGIEPWMQVVEVSDQKRFEIKNGFFAIDDVFSFMHKKRFFVNNQLVLPDHKNYMLQASNNLHPCPNFPSKHPVVEIIPGMKPVCISREGNEDHEVVASYRSLHSTRKRCPPNKYRSTYGTHFNVSSNGSLTIKTILHDSADMDCFYMHTPESGVTCLYAYGSPLLFQSIQISPSLPVTTPFPPLPYTRRPRGDPECTVDYEDIPENFEVFEWVGGCLFRLHGMPTNQGDYNRYLDESNCTPLNERFHVRRAVFAQSPYQPDYMFMLAEFVRDNITRIGSAHVKIPEFKIPTNVTSIVTEPEDDEDAYQIDDILGVDLAITRMGGNNPGDHIFVLKNGELLDKHRLFPGTMDDEQTMYIQKNRIPEDKFNYSNADIDAIRTLRDRYEYLNSDPRKKEHSVMGNWAVRYDNSRDADGVHSTLQLFRSPKCIPTAFKLYGRRIFLMPAITTTPVPQLPGISMDEYIARSLKLKEMRERRAAEGNTLGLLVVFLTLLCTVLPMLGISVGCWFWVRRQNRRAAEGYANEEREEREDHWLVRLFDL